VHIQSIRVGNFRSIEDSGLLTFERGFNLIVGANNVGKSSFDQLGGGVQYYLGLFIP
jgi:predicted ATP-dependent endonuclease of OLD family